MTASPRKTIFTLLVCCLTVLNTSGAAQACWLTDWLWGHRNTAAPVAPPVITTGYAPVAYPVQQVNYQSPVCGPVCPQTGTTTAGYLPQVDYQSQYQRVPTTVYRPVPVYQPNSAGVPVVGYQGCTTSQYQVQRVPTASFAPASTTPSCGCGSQGYAGQPMPSVSGGTYQSSQPGAWVPRAEGTIPSTGGTYSNGTIGTQPQTYSQGQIQAAPSQGTYGQQGSIYQSQPSTVSPAPMMQQYDQQQQFQQQPQQQQPADQRPALRPELQYDQQQQIQVQPQDPELNGSGSATIQGSTTGNYTQPMPSSSASAPATTMQRPGTMTVSPSSASSSQPSSTSPWQVAPVTPIPDPEFSTSGPQNEAPQLLDPRDKTAGLDQSQTIVPVSHQMSAERPAYKPPTASIGTPTRSPSQSQDSGWYSAGR